MDCSGSTCKEEVKNPDCEEKPAVKDKPAAVESPQGDYLKRKLLQLRYMEQFLGPGDVTTIAVRLAYEQALENRAETRTTTSCSEPSFPPPFTRQRVI